MTTSLVGQSATCCAVAMAMTCSSEVTAKMRFTAMLALTF